MLHTWITCYPTDEAYTHRTKDKATTKLQKVPRQGEKSTKASSSWCCLVWGWIYPRLPMETFNRSQNTASKTNSLQQVSLTRLRYCHLGQKNCCTWSRATFTGQILKEFAQKSNIDSERLDGRETGTRNRMRKKATRRELSAPSFPSLASVNESWKEMVDSGQLWLGVPWAPFALTHYSVNSGHLERKQSVVTGRKFPLKDLRQKLLHEDGTEEEELREWFKQLQRTRSLALWHDNATLLIGSGDSDDHITCCSWPEAKGSTAELTSVQSTIEHPVIHMIAAGSSLVENQAALLQDRIDCILTLSDPVVTSNGLEITDKLFFCWRPPSSTIRTKYPAMLKIPVWWMCMESKMSWWTI